MEMEAESLTAEMEVEEQEMGVGPQCLAAMVDSGTVESRRYYLARCTLLEMLSDRGFYIPEDDLALSLSDFRAKFGDHTKLENLSISSSHLTDSSKKILVGFCGTEPIKLATVRDIFSMYGKDNLSSLILVIQSKMTSKARDALKEIFKYKVETFQITELLVNITKHVLKPRHDLLTTEEKQNLLKKYNIVESQLPRMLETDAIARYYGYQKGQVVKVTYEGELTGSHVTYRCVV